MPYKDGTGPQGQGPAVGRGFGTCCGGRGAHFRFRFNSLSKEQTKEELELYKKNLEAELEQVKIEQKKLEDNKQV